MSLSLPSFKIEFGDREVDSITPDEILILSDQAH